MFQVVNIQLTITSFTFEPQEPLSTFQRFIPKFTYSFTYCAFYSPVESMPLQWVMANLPITWNPTVRSPLRCVLFQTQAAICMLLFASASIFIHGGKVCTHPSSSSSSSRWHSVWCQYRTPEGMRKSTQMVCVSCLRCSDLFAVHCARQHFHLYDGEGNKIKKSSHVSTVRDFAVWCVEEGGISGNPQPRSGRPRWRQSSGRPAPTCREQRAACAGLH